ncbi:hypothetical protein KC326_g176 [Hortaea werneckii]|nr:hypothetical protein KC326_g176 [Hortaea werneckii]
MSLGKNCNRFHKPLPKLREPVVQLIMIRNVQSRNGLIPPIQQHVYTALQARHTAIVPINDHGRPTGIPSRPLPFVRPGAGVKEDGISTPRHLVFGVVGGVTHVSPAVPYVGGRLVNEDAVDVEIYALALRRRAARSRPSRVLGDVGSDGA